MDVQPVADGERRESVEAAEGGVVDDVELTSHGAKAFEAIQASERRVVLDLHVAIDGRERRHAGQRAERGVA